MGYDVDRFQNEIDEELLCPICSGVLEDPRQAPNCEHAFCIACISEWLARQSEGSCPVDRLPVSHSQLQPVPRVLRNLLSRLLISCDNSQHGCNAIVKLDALDIHLDKCDFNPKRPVLCERGCGLTITKDEQTDHNCVRELRLVVQSQHQRVNEFQQELTDQRFQLHEQKRELQLLKDFMHAMKMSNPSMRAIADQMEREELVRWSLSLPKAKVTRWGGMISTPDVVLQATIKRALSESNCPPHIIDELMENAHERRWPPGLCSLEARQMNRVQYENYFCRKIQGKQAVIVLAIDNPNVNADMMVEPGLVMIFALGVE